MRLSPRETARSLLDAAIRAELGSAPEVPIERTRRPEHGDFASNVALTLAGAWGRKPRDLAQAIVARLVVDRSTELAEAQVAGPGFINLRFSSAFWQGALAPILQDGEGWGRGRAPAGAPRILLEYLSANPTGPLHVAHGRHAAVGDALARLLRFAGYDVTTEFYVNDAGNQVQMLALSVWTRYMEEARAVDPTVPAVPFPADGYKGAYVRDFGSELWARDGRRWIGVAPPADLGPIRSFAIERCLAMIKGTLGRFDVAFDAWQSEQALHAAGTVAATLAALEAAGQAYEQDGAVWLRTTVLGGDDKDRVLRKSDGQAAYFLADIAYHRAKVARGFGEVCDIWGSDHHGHIPRMRAAFKAFGHDPDMLRVLLIQTVRLVRDGEEVKMGKRAGEFVTLDDLVEEVGRDATRFFYLMRRHDTPLEFDLALARKQSMDNPVFYAQYAHARCASILRKAVELGAPRPPVSAALAARLDLPEEIALLRRLAEFPDFVADAAAAREPHRLTTFLQELAGDFQSYYTRLGRGQGDFVLPQDKDRESGGDWRSRWDWDKTAARLAWIEAIRQVLRNGLHLLGVSAPEAMSRSEGADAA